MESDKKIFSLVDLASSLRSVIERSYSSTYWIKAEIAKLNHYPRSGHCYPDLVEKVGNQVVAQMRSTIWASDYKYINHRFIETTGQPLSEGMFILFQASVGYHPVHGLSLQISEIEPAFTVGQMAMEKQKTIDRLRKEEIFDNNKAREMPLLPRKLAVISVETSKGYHDFLKILTGYENRFTVWHHLFPSLLQGDKAVENLTSQLRAIRKNAHLFDMVAIIRGGGGDVGLACYDNYILCREIATFPIPVLSGIGHATNETISEMVAWQNMATPTDLAYFVVNRFVYFESRLQDSRGALELNSAKMILLQRKRLLSAAQTIRSFSLKSLSHSSSLLKYLRQKLKSEALNFISKEKKALDYKKGSIDFLNPENILKRGFSITYFNGKGLKNPTELKEGDIVKTRLHQGEFKSIVNKKIEKYEQGN